MIKLKRIFALLIIICIALTLFACDANTNNAEIAATTLPVYEFTKLLCVGTNLQVAQVITEDVSCLHDYTLQIQQMKILESAEMIIISGAGLESFLDDVLSSQDNLIDASAGIELYCHEETFSDHHSHEHQDADPHYWLSPCNAKIMSENILSALCKKYPDQRVKFEENYISLSTQLDALNAYAQSSLKDLKTRNIITFHDGFSYLAGAYDLHILKAIEEESGSEASAKELIDMCELVRSNELSAVFTEKNGSVSAAEIIARETNVHIYQLDMAISGDSYFTAMRHNIDTLKEALG